MNHRDEYGLMPRVPEEYKGYTLSLDDLDSHVYEFDRGCEDGQKAFVDFIMQKVLLPYEWEELVQKRNFIKFCEQWDNYEAKAISRDYVPCTSGFEPIYDPDHDYFWPFCENCYKTEDQHCHCGDCETGLKHLVWALDAGVVRRR